MLNDGLTAIFEQQTDLEMPKAALYLICFSAGGVGAWLIAHFGKVIGLLDKPKDRGSHSSVIPKGGGVGILGAFLFISVWEGFTPLLWIPAGALAVFSLVGDRVEISPKLRLISQFVAAWFFLSSLDLQVSDPLKWIILIFPLSVFLVGTANFYNFMDGINGIAGITGLVGFGLLGSLAYLGGHESAAVVVSISMSLACLGFLPFNMPRAKVFMGDVGSILLGFVFAQIVILLSRNFLDLICYASLLLPFYVDELATMVERLKDGENLLKAHRRHIYQVLANEGGISHWKVSVGYGLAQLLIGISILIVKSFGFLAISFVLASFFIVSVFTNYWVRRKYEGAHRRH